MTVEELSAIEAIRQLKARYFRLLDTQQWDEWGQVFREDARLQWGPTSDEAVAGRDQIVDVVSASLRGATTCHHGATSEIEILGPERARGIWAMSDIVDHPEFHLVGKGHYHEEYTRDDGGWRIQSTRIVRLMEQRTARSSSGS